MSKHANAEEETKHTKRRATKVVLTILLAACLVGAGALVAWHFLAPGRTPAPPSPLSRACLTTRSAPSSIARSRRAA